ncbi:hypothetical protein [Planococcus halocryophilus]|uniref:hypothetical protein n=1 Tax=Planococcus halocryophilus TaxID=1215089 RepID=UPI001F26BFAF|nr:hypothetical protein [Planococcus halocryophilus]
MATLMPERLYFANDSSPLPRLPIMTGQWMTVVPVSYNIFISSPCPVSASL